VATLTQRLLDDGAQWCAIFADVDNATTNTIYRRIGYKEHGTYREYDFVPNETG
jgi:predicted GNAT family acetyltransferase